MRWALLLQKYDLEVEYVAGKANVLADCASRMPLQEWAGLLDDAAFDLTADIPATNAVFAAYEEWKQEKDRQMLAKKCEVCQLGSELGGAVFCDRCGKTWHFHCAGVETVPDGYWYCKQCERLIAELNLCDLKFDRTLVDYLHCGQIPEEDSDKKRVGAAAKFMRWHADTL